MTDTHSTPELPECLDDIDSAFMTHLLRQQGLIGPTNSVKTQTEAGVGMTAGYFSAIKKVACQYSEACDAPTSFVAKAWPPFEILPREAIADMFKKDIEAYKLPADRFYPRLKAYLADYDEQENRWGLVMEDADTFADHKVHETELNVDEVLTMIPKLVDVAVAWEGADTGDKADQLTGLGVDHWASESNMAMFKAVMPGGAKLADKLFSLENSSIIGDNRWIPPLGRPGTAEVFTTKLDAFFEAAHPRSGATCTLSHGDLRGDNIFFCDPDPEHPDGWLCIDFQLMCRGPIPSDLAYLMNSGSVLPEVYTGENLDLVLRTFYDQFMAKTTRYTDYTYEAFLHEYTVMMTKMFIHVVGMGAAIVQDGAFNNSKAARVELGGQGATEADLTPEELRQRMWWRKLFANMRSSFNEFDLYETLEGLLANHDGLAEWTELPDHLT